MGSTVSVKSRFGDASLGSLNTFVSTPSVGEPDGRRERERPKMHPGGGGRIGVLRECRRRRTDEGGGQEHVALEDPAVEPSRFLTWRVLVRRQMPERAVRPALIAVDAALRRRCLSWPGGVRDEHREQHGVRRCLQPEVDQFLQRHGRHTDGRAVSGPLLERSAAAGAVDPRATRTARTPSVTPSGRPTSRPPSHSTWR